MRTHSRACRLSVTPGNNRRSSITAESSPRWWKASRIAVASALVTENMAGGWACVAGNATRRSNHQENRHRSCRSSECRSHELKVHPAAPIACLRRAATLVIPLCQIECAQCGEDATKRGLSPRAETHNRVRRVVACGLVPDPSARHDLAGTAGHQRRSTRQRADLPHRRRNTTCAAETGPPHARLRSVRALSVTRIAAGHPVADATLPERQPVAIVRSRRAYRARRRSAWSLPPNRADHLP